MFAFARAVGDESAPGDPRHRLGAMAHLERAFAFREDTDGGEAYREDPVAHAEITGAAERSVFSSSFGTSAHHVLTLNTFAMAFGCFRRFDLARPLLERIGETPTRAPWSYFGERAGAVFLSYRRQAGLAPPR
jgi:hypothetical protein